MQRFVKYDGGNVVCHFVTLSFYRLLPCTSPSAMPLQSPALQIPCRCCPVVPRARIWGIGPVLTRR